MYWVSTEHDMSTWQRVVQDNGQTMTSKWLTYLTAFSAWRKQLPNAFRFLLSAAKDSVMYHQIDPMMTISLFLFKYSLRIRAQPVTHHVGPMAKEDDVEDRAKPSAPSPTILLDRRLEELGLPKRGTKLEKWSRIEHLEREQLRATRARVALQLQRTSVRTGAEQSWRCLWLRHENRLRQSETFMNLRTCLLNHGAHTARVEEGLKTFTSVWRWNERDRLSR